MPEFSLDMRESITSIEQRRAAHGWVTGLAEDLLAKAETDRYVEFGLRTDTANAAEMLKVMALDDLYIPPGERMGQPVPIDWDDDYEGKFSLFYGFTFVVPPEAERIYVVSSVEQYDKDDPPVRYVALGLQYKYRNVTFRQLMGVAAHPNGQIDATQVNYGENAAGDTLFKDGSSRPITYSDAWMFVDCMRELFVLPR